MLRNPLVGDAVGDDDDDDGVDAGDDDYDDHVDHGGDDDDRGDDGDESKRKIRDSRLHMLPG